MPRRDRSNWPWRCAPTTSQVSPLPSGTWRFGARRPPNSGPVLASPAPPSPHLTSYLVSSRPEALRAGREQRAVHHALGTSRSRAARLIEVGLGVAVEVLVRL